MFSKYTGINPKRFLQEKSGANKLPNEVKLNENDIISDDNENAVQTTQAPVAKRRPKNLFELLVQEAGLIDDKGKKKERALYSNLTINRPKLFKIAEILKSNDEKEPIYIYKTDNDKKGNKTNDTVLPKN